MVRVLIEQMLGTWGTALLDFYHANSLFINLLIVLYGGLVVLSWTNLKGIRRQLVQNLVAQLQAIPNLEVDAQPHKVLRQVNIPWEQAIEQRRFPFVAEQTSFLPRRATLAIVQSLLPPEELASDALKSLAPRRNGIAHRSRR
jgi:hypothetical protein